jgi:hypothetical protein
MTTNDNEFYSKNAHKFCCESCDFNTSKKSDYERHLDTQKHKNNVLTTDDNAKNAKKYACEYCEKEYTDRAGLWRHKKRCSGEKTHVNFDEPSDKELIMMLIKQNTQLIQQNAELVKNGTHITTNHTNSHNKTFNLQLFLNETCKDAMNIMDFVESIKLQLCDLENVGKVGFVEGISHIILRNLNLLDETKRPVHCTDTKREVMYVKDEDKWEKEDENKEKIRKMINQVKLKNTKLLKEFRTKYPGCDKSDSKISGKYDKLTLEAFGGKGDNDFEKENKIIRNISKAITIDKNV